MRNKQKLLLVLLIIFILRLPANMKLPRDMKLPEDLRLSWTSINFSRGDESRIFVVSQDIVRGGVPYKTTWGHKGPLIYFMLALIIKLFGNNVFALHIFTTIYLLVSILFVYLISNKLFKKEVSLFVSLTYGLFFSSTKFGGHISNGEIFMMLPAIIAVYFFIIYMQNEKKLSTILLLCGLFTAAAILTKQVAFFTTVICPLTLIIKNYRIKQYNWSLFLKEILFYLSGVAILFLAVLLYFVLHNAVKDFWFGFYTFNMAYVKALSVAEELSRFIIFLCFALKEDYITLLSVFSIILIIFKKDYFFGLKSFIYFVIGLTFFSLVGVLFGGKMFEHYFLQMGLPFSLLIGLGISLVKMEEKDLNKIFYAVTLVIAIYSIINLANFLANYRKEHTDTSYKIAKYIKENTTERDTLFILGDETIIYFLTNRKAPSKYFDWIYISSYVGRVLEVGDSVLLELNKNKAKYIIYYKSEWLTKLYHKRINEIEDFIFQNYNIEKVIDNHLIYARKNL